MKKKTHNGIDFKSLLCNDKIKKTTANLLSYKNLRIVIALLIVLPVIITALMHKGVREVALNDADLIEFESTPLASAVGQKGVISIPAGTVKANPFLPYRDIGGTAKAIDVPTYTLVEPPEVINENSDAARVMDTIVSGILFDKYSPSAILNIEGNDYLVKKGDIVNNYKVLNIMQDSVTVKLGANVYKAGIGEILTEGEMNHNTVSNLNNKFGGGK